MYLFEEIIAWVIVTLITISIFCSYAKYVSPEIWNYIVAFLFGWCMNKSKILGATLIVVIFVLIIYFGYNNYQEKNRLKNDKLELTNKIEQLQQTIAKNNQIIADNEQSKRELENQSIERQEQINEQLKNNDCANQLLPNAVSNSLYNRAKNLRQSTDTSKSIKWLCTSFTS